MPTIKRDCDHAETLSISAGCGSQCDVVFPDGTHFFGALPPIPGLGDGAFIDLNICMRCHRVVGFRPTVVKQLAVDAKSIEKESQVES